ncbi:uncharacterized protein K489DRAFT_370952 [Dissoconium aciculare CBS 342.82]|uniref:Carbohydrate esterase family 5 protein n=1 Tax=Dissoconium aciculare CBS 342.82 TaxID=1314786 RepID=A0A6J3M238_9PEZI|nr:uncharacterized protein K489DRAFT_370952 [Dissoconium aciculare CBS 342.82]KAF1822071.1 hypothetical protein K489DRAFT_370952 [Dissoconium aciculare CBS 342.82]
MVDVGYMGTLPGTNLHTNSGRSRSKSGASRSLNVFTCPSNQQASSPHHHDIPSLNSAPPRSAHSSDYPAIPRFSATSDADSQIDLLLGRLRRVPGGYRCQQVGSIGVADAQRLTTSYHAACPKNKIVLMGYSQGAIVSGSALAGGPAYVPIFGSTGAGHAALDSEIGDSIFAILQFGDLNCIQVWVLKARYRTSHASQTRLVKRFLRIGYIRRLSSESSPKNGPQAYPRNGSAEVDWRYYSNKIDDFCANSEGSWCKNKLTSSPTWDIILRRMRRRLVTLCWASSMALCESRYRLDVYEAPMNDMSPLYCERRAFLKELHASGMTPP